MLQTAGTFAQYRAVVQPRIEAALAAYCEFDHRCPAELADAIRYSLLSGGKRLRPLLVLMAADACGSSEQDAMPAACAVEMIHAYSLIHDDLPAMDDDDLRRGRPTNHKVYGEAMAILAGDALQTLAFAALAEIQPPEAAAACCAALAEAAGACGMVGGQADDMAEKTGEPQLAQLESIHERKTGAMLNVSLRLGALVAGASDEQFEALAQYGRRLGLAFQITDDLLDVEGDEAKVGKRVGKDTARGKLTFPGLLGIEQSRNRAKELVSEACQALAPFGAGASRLEALATYVLERNH